MPKIQSMGSGYYNYYDITSRYSCETPYEAWYKKDLSTKEICSNNDVNNKDSERAAEYRKLEDTYAAVAVSNRARYSSVDDLRGALNEKYKSNGAYANYSAEERNAMYLNELSMTCFGMIDCHTGMGGGEVLADPHLKGTVKTTSKSSAETNKSLLNTQIKNVFANSGIDISLFGDNLFSFTIDPFTKYLTVTLAQEDENSIVSQELLQQIEDALNSNKNGSNLFYNLLYENNREGTIPQDVLTKFKLMSEFQSVTGLDIREFVQTENGFFNDKGENALDLYKKGLKTTSKVPAEFKGAAYSYFTQLVEKSLSKPISNISDLTLSASYKNGMLTNTAAKASASVSGVNFDMKV